MYEGMFSLMQMAKTSAALAYHAQQRLPYISVLTHPTTAGVMASYQAVVSGSHAPVAVNVPAILEVINVAPTKLGFKIMPVTGAEFYEFQGTVGTNPPQLLGVAKNTRNPVMEKLVSGTTYILQVRAGFGGNRFSEWSEPVTHMCT